MIFYCLISGDAMKRNPHMKSDLHQGLYVAPPIFSTAAPFNITHFFDILVHLFGLQPHALFFFYKYYRFFFFHESLSSGFPPWLTLTFSATLTLPAALR